jgi:hypothetical protein
MNALLWEVQRYRHMAAVLQAVEDDEAREAVLQELEARVEEARSQARVAQNRLLAIGHLSPVPIDTAIRVSARFQACELN